MNPSKVVHPQIMHKRSKEIRPNSMERTQKDVAIEVYLDPNLNLVWLLELDLIRLRKK